MPPSAAPEPVIEFGRRRVLVVVAVMMAALLQTLDATIVNVALPTIEGNLGASIDDGTWIITGYIIANVVAIPLAPFLMLRLGRRRYYATCIIGFTVASVLCGTATSLETLVLYRVVQGAFGGGLIATSQVILRETFPPAKVGAAAALFAIALTVGPALGPTVGGILTDAFSWPWVFDINLVPGAISAGLVLTVLRDPLPPQRLPLDVVGIALLVAIFGSMQYVLDEGNRADWFGDDRIVGCAVAGLVSAVAFAIWELRGARAPIVDLRIFRFPNLRAGFPAGMLIGMVVFGPTIMLPQYVQGVLGFTATLSGLLVLLRALPVMLLTPLVARLATRVDARFLLAGGLVVSAVSFAAISAHMTPQSDFGTFAAWMVLSGVGQSMLLVPLLVGILGSVPPREAPKSSSMISLSVQLGGSIASTALVTVFDQRTYFHADIYRGSAVLANPALRDLLHHAVPLAVVSRIVQLQASNAGFADAIDVLAAIALAALGVVVFLKRGVAPAAAVPAAAE